MFYIRISISPIQIAIFDGFGVPPVLKHTRIILSIVNFITVHLIYSVWLSQCWMCVRYHYKDHVLSYHIILFIWSHSFGAKPISSKHHLKFLLTSSQSSAQFHKWLNTNLHLTLPPLLMGAYTDQNKIFGCVWTWGTINPKLQNSMISDGETARIDWNWSFSPNFPTNPAMPSPFSSPP